MVPSILGRPNISESINFKGRPLNINGPTNIGRTNNEGPGQLVGHHKGPELLGRPILGAWGVAPRA